MNGVDYWRSNPPRSLLFVPADRAHRFLPTAYASPADGLIFDLEDAVAESNKDRARADLVDLLLAAPPRHMFFARVNAGPDERLERDVAAAVAIGASGVLLPKARTAADVAHVSVLLSRTEGQHAAEPTAVVALLETPDGIVAGQSIASADARVVGVGFGPEDLAAELGVRRTGGGLEVLFARSHVVLAAAAAGCWALDPPPMDLHDDRLARREAVLARRLGFVGKFAIHPRQVPVLNDVFTPTDEEVDWANRVQAALDAANACGSGTATVDGRLVDEPTRRLARRILARGAAR